MSHIWVPKVKIIEATFEPKTRIAGYYKLQVIRPDGSVRVDTGWFPNLITNIGLDQYDSSGFFSTCAVGSGNTAPAFTDTQLVSLVASTTNTVGSTTQAAQSSSPYFGTTTKSWAFVAGTATGNLSEVGIGVDATHLFSRALILDGGGSPTTITILSTEQLNVTYQLGSYVPLTDLTGTITLNAISYSYTLRAANATSAARWAYVPQDASSITGLGGPFSGNFFSTTVTNGSIGAITGQPSGTSNSCDSATASSYTNGSFTRAGTSTWSINTGNLSGGVTAATVGFGQSNASRGQYQVSFSPAIPKDNTHVLTLNWSNSWTRGP